MTVPVIIHLWNIRPSKTLKVGSIALLGEAARQTSKSLRISEWLLLLLRCLFIAVIAILLAQPLLHTTVKPNRRPWILIQKNQLPAIYARYASEIDSLLNTGASLHTLAPGFPLLDLSDTTGMTDTANNHLPCWQLLKVLNHQIADSLPVYVYAANRLTYFSGERPALQLAVHWRLLETGNSTSTNNFLAFQSRTDSLVLLKSVSKSNGNFFSKETIPATNKVAADRIEHAKKICIYHNKTTQEDARYLRSALEAISQFTQFDFQITACNDPIEIPAQQDAIFWLSEQETDAIVDESLQTGGMLFYYGNRQTNISQYPVADRGNSTLPPVAVYKSNVDSTAPYATGQGITNSALLTGAIKNKRKHYQFNSRLLPAWNNLVWEDDFPRILLSLLFPEKQQIQHDLRNIDPLQVATSISTLHPSVITKETVSQPIELSHWCWLLAFLLLVSERWLSWRKNKHIHVR